jgi:hypothetical protein
MNTLNTSIDAVLPRLDWSETSLQKWRLSCPQVPRLPLPRIASKPRRHPIALIEQALFLCLGAGFVLMLSTFVLQFLR